MAWIPFPRVDQDRGRLRHASDTSDGEWRVIEPLMPPRPARGRKRRTDLRAVIDAIFRLLQSGCQWGLCRRRTSRPRTRCITISSG